jgi:hypothetical protein
LGIAVITIQRSKICHRSGISSQTSFGINLKWFESLKPIDSIVLIMIKDIIYL